MDFRDFLIKQFENYDHPSVHLYWKTIYDKIDQQLPAELSVLEVGAGAGTSSKFLKGQNIVRTDLISFPEANVIGNMDLTALKLESEQFGAVFAVDVLHHIQNPFAGLAELKRVLIDHERARIILVEPYVSLASYPIYALFHHERTTFPFDRRKDVRLRSNSPEDANQTMSRWIFYSKAHRAKLMSVFPASEYTIELSWNSFLLFFMLGRLEEPLKIPISLLRIQYFIENLIPQLIMKFLASRIIVVISKK
jgi:SAM-dependent methyltransferase